MDQTIFLIFWVLLDVSQSFDKASLKLFCVKLINKIKCLYFWFGGCGKGNARSFQGGLKCKKLSAFLVQLLWSVWMWISQKMSLIFGPLMDTNLHLL